MIWGMETLRHLVERSPECPPLILIYYAGMGMKFTNAHVTNSVCVPSRTSIMTGPLCLPFQERRPRRTMGIYWSSVSRRLNIPLGDMFQSGGYRTGYVGKWHLGTRMTTKGRENPGALQILTLPSPFKLGPRIMGLMSAFFYPVLLICFPTHISGERSGRVA
jgi:arylsulfatase A-like enzyme